MPFDALRAHLAPVHDLGAAANVLEWDEETYAPEAATQARAHQVATLRRLAHEAFVSADTERFLAEAERASASLDPDSDDAALARVARHDFERATRLPSRLVSELAEAVGLAKPAWRDAREASAFERFAPHLERLVALNVEKAGLLMPGAHPYDALLDLYEPGGRMADAAVLFADLRACLVPLVQHVARAPQPDDAFLRARYGRDAQWAFGLRVLEDAGFDARRGRLDVSAHPFTTTFSTTDVRLTTRVDERYFPTAFFGTLHEAGHGLYEQNISPALERTLLAEGTSLGMHESQSRLWENLVGRSRAFWAHYLPILRAAFPDALAGVTLDAFHAAINRAEPSPIRVEADEVTYNLHIMLRFEIEVELVEGRLAVRDLPERWNAGMRDYLGITPSDDAHGVLQDVHWALGTLGYFPTYTLGTLMSVQLFEAAERDLGPLDAAFARGELLPLLGWMRAHVHHFGRTRTAAEILHDATGGPLSAEPWLRYVTRKYGALYPGFEG